MYGLDFLILYANTLREYHVVERLHLLLIKTTFLPVGIKEMDFELIDDPLNGIIVIRFVKVDQDIIQIYDLKDI